MKSTQDLVIWQKELGEELGYKITIMIYADKSFVIYKYTDESNMLEILYDSGSMIERLDINDLVYECIPQFAEHLKDLATAKDLLIEDL